ncbi:MAG TPA: sensor domain-containing protein [Pseudomonadota bacterium]|nr:sensor domain-containing protein [Xanthomonadales bacterium]HQW63571.1 sensor domain-containing protein [Pseudomonadota bacterium]MBP6691895.1 sensor domain-containing protein [Xanthomonadales bacterium]MBP7418366.1 sensor domain-containing protein [Xanthomonadales bacterium]HQX24815.1 sensor domain-containing protein [Pseudomonadota bacterium]
MNTPLPTTIEQYLEQIRAALGAADPALIQDALYDAEEHLRAERAEHPDETEAAVLARVAGSYGSPEEVAAIYLDTEVTVARALRSPPPAPRKGAIARFFGVAADPRTYGALFYMLLSLATGIFYFTWVVTGLSLSAGLFILIIGIPFLVLFLATVRVLSLVEGRIVETMLGERMPRRPLYTERGLPWMERIKRLFTDARTWSTMLYFGLMLPLGTVYFTIAVTGLTLTLSLIATPFAWLFGEHAGLRIDDWHFGPGVVDVAPGLALPLLFVLGVLGFFAMLHLARGVGRLHGAIAKQLLVKSATY